MEWTFVFSEWTQYIILKLKSMFHLDTSLSRTTLESLSSIHTRGTSFSLSSQSKDMIKHQITQSNMKGHKKYSEHCHWNLRTWAPAQDSLQRVLVRLLTSCMSAVYSNLLVHPHLQGVLGFLVILDFPEKKNKQTGFSFCQRNVLLA